MSDAEYKEFTRLTVHIDWLVETVNIESEDIVDTQCCDTLADARRAMQCPLQPGHRYDYGLVRDRGSNASGMIDRQWAYVEDGILPDEFDGGAKVPQTYYREFSAAIPQGCIILTTALTGARYEETDDCPADATYCHTSDRQFIGASRIFLLSLPWWPLHKLVCVSAS